jgi:hypothetical protein
MRTQMTGKRYTCYVVRNRRATIDCSLLIGLATYRKKVTYFLVPPPIRVCLPAVTIELKSMFLLFHCSTFFVDHNPSSNEMFGE